MRATLINKGVVIAGARGEVCFSAPGFDRFILNRQGLDPIDTTALDTPARPAVIRPAEGQHTTHGPREHEDDRDGEDAEDDE